MNRGKAVKPLKELNLTNRFLFDEVMEDAETHRTVLSIIFGRDIPPLIHNETEKESRISPTVRSIRMDVFSMDENEVVYNTEMQTKKKMDLAKRSRYYQALVDTSLLEPGIPDYRELKDSYIIMIMTFDFFGWGKYQYTFTPDCREVSGCSLEDGATRIFLNTEGQNPEEVSDELVAFLKYIKESTDDVALASDSKKVQQIHRRVCKVRASEEVGVRYMQAWEEKYFDRQEGREEGVMETKQKVIQRMLQEGFSEDVIMRITEITKEELERICSFGDK
ncbi:Rpn family recombination-promoting nuclease/putative transposase [Frisingicoccus sp.]|jgi:predicted transposase/invertase (TIGR01784 family)|uniref:Rpn family recombination-promoting nuclease/putative transposase n=1 Tax=Frisingicoccus sp. TaxID=1918627 RepID=UPI002E78405D|nr:Rpn family recombination-promoting nuclease/putative transposase [Frisingicoccus sp.]MEE0752181.1 Rpn family recombination-promoting nuclease/putative transposase [Frisingicoccus sp.]